VFTSPRPLCVDRFVDRMTLIRPILLPCRGSQRLRRATAERIVARQGVRRGRSDHPAGDPPYLHPPVTATVRFGVSVVMITGLGMPESAPCPLIARAGGRVTGARSARAAAPQASLTRPSGSGSCRAAGGREAPGGAGSGSAGSGSWPFCAGDQP
jgi:hypothetical protein